MVSNIKVTQRYVLSILLMLNLVGCGDTDRKKVLYIGSPDGSQWITHISNNDIQYIIDGRVEYVPDTNYVVLDVSNKELQVHNGFYISWQKSINKRKWTVTMDRARLLITKLDTNRFCFKTQFPKGEDGFPSSKILKNKGHFGVDIELEIKTGSILLEKGILKRQKLLSFSDIEGN